MPQGSLLGSLLFILYINDIVNIRILGCKIKMFADDTIVYFKSLRVDSVEYVFNKQLGKIYNWLFANKIKLNEGKCKFMLIRSAWYNGNTDCNIKIANEKLEQIKEYLSVMIDDVLTFKKHV